jgi:hypothetical protein
MPYSNESYGYSEIDFTVKLPAVFDNKVNLVPVDKVLSNQLGGVTLPPTDYTTLPQVVGYPLLPQVSEGDAKPLLTSYAGSEISLPTTLSSTDLNSVSVNDIVTPQVKPTQSAQPAQPKPEPITVKPVPMAPMNAPIAVPSRARETFENPPQNNLANFIRGNNPVGRVEKFGPQHAKKVEHFGSKKVEHFGGLKTMDNIVFILVVCALGYYYASTYHPEYIRDMDMSKIPILSQLQDSNVTTENKVIIVIAIVIGLILITRMLK